MNNIKINYKLIESKKSELSISFWDLTPYFSLINDYNDNSTWVIKKIPNTAVEWEADLGTEYGINYFDLGHPEGALHLDLIDGNYKIEYISGVYTVWDTFDKSTECFPENITHVWNPSGAMRFSYGILPSISNKCKSEAEKLSKGLTTNFSINDGLGLSIWIADTPLTDNFGTIKYRIYNLDTFSELIVGEYSKDKLPNSIELEPGYIYELYIKYESYCENISEIIISTKDIENESEEWNLQNYSNLSENYCDNCKWEISRISKNIVEWDAVCNSFNFSIYTTKYNPHPGIFHLNLPQGKYRIEYVSGASNNKGTSYGNWNREWSIENGLDEGHDCSNGQRWMVFQCTYGVLPRFSLEGRNTAKETEQENIGKNLEFEIKDDLGLDIWYDDWYANDNNGTIRYRIVKLDNIQETEEILDRYELNNLPKSYLIEPEYIYYLKIKCDISLTCLEEETTIANFTGEIKKTLQANFDGPSINDLPCHWELEGYKNLRTIFYGCRNLCNRFCR